MPRCAREKSESGIYHIIMRGINRQSIFEDEEDYFQYLNAIRRYKEKCGYQIYAYCLMGNHVHLLFRQKQGDRRIVSAEIILFSTAFFKR